MTGYGVAARDFMGQTLTVEIRALNGRFRETAARLPQALGFLEDPLKKIVAECVHRGRVEIRLQIGYPKGRLPGLSFDPGRAEAALALLQRLKDETGVDGPIKLSHLLALDVLNEPAGLSLEADPSLIRPVAESLAQEALGQLIEFREREGEALERDLLTRLTALGEIMGRIKGQAREANLAIFQKLKARIAELTSQSVDPSRLAQEAAILAERMDINEEIVRFDSHLAAFRQTLAEGGPIGRRLEFTLQELGREANTMGAKSQWGPLTEEVLALKSELEKAREQAQNIE
jgi:uncharacterized protein (TIGR00255 family)